MEPRRYQVIPPEPNKRQFPRVRWSSAVQLSPQARMSYGALSCDISHGGLGMKVHQFVPVGSEVSLCVSLGLERILECKGKVVWVKRVPYAEDDQYTIGVSFDSKSLEQSEDFEDFLTWKLSEPSTA